LVQGKKQLKTALAQRAEQKPNTVKSLKFGDIILPLISYNGKLPDLTVITAFSISE
jgi:hypothetical protein